MGRGGGGIHQGSTRIYFDLRIPPPPTPPNDHDDGDDDVDDDDDVADANDYSDSNTNTSGNVQYKGTVDLLMRRPVSSYQYQVIQDRTYGAATTAHPCHSRWTDFVLLCTHTKPCREAKLNGIPGNNGRV